MNCPFCFALNEWVSEAKQARLVKWRGIEHMPELVIGEVACDNVRDDLVNEVGIVNTRVDNIELHVPDYRPNTGLALSMLVAAEEHCPESAADLRMALFRALWRDNKDISNPEVVQSIMKKFASGLGTNLDTDFSDYALQVSRNTEEWRQFDRIPTLKAPTGATYLGLGDQQALSTFMGSALFDIEREYACYPKN
ncbi:MAG: hypothetical protein JKY56_04915 [Kofleriaceae bacterium]|nr:hypothetical protein [Kofleriaceae bacterium]